jgi:ribonuclease-3
LEAIFGAVFLDSGFDAARAVIDGVYESRYRDLPDVRDLRDPKTQLQEWLQARKMSLPEYELAEVSGKDHKQRFVVTCTIVETSCVTDGESTTRRKAEQKAARKMIEQLAETQE